MTASIVRVPRDIMIHTCLGGSLRTSKARIDCKEQPEFIKSVGEKRALSDSKRSTHAVEQMTRETLSKCSTKSLEAGLRTYRLMHARPYVRKPYGRAAIRRGNFEPRRRHRRLGRLRVLIYAQDTSLSEGASVL